MKKLWSVLLLCGFFANPAHAAWQKIAEWSDETIYVDPASIKRRGDVVSLIFLRDFKADRILHEAGPAYLSKVVRQLVSCKKKQSMAIEMRYYEQAMGEGILLDTLSRSVKAGEWQDWEPGSTGAAVYDVACQKSKRK